MGEKDLKIIVKGKQLKIESIVFEGGEVINLLVAEGRLAYRIFPENQSIDSIKLFLQSFIGKNEDVTIKEDCELEHAIYIKYGDDTQKFSSHIING